MKAYSLLLAALGAGSAYGVDVPDVVITTLSSANSYATVAGRLVSKPAAPVGISVRNGNLTYSTITDPEGRWGIVIRHQAVQVTVTSWSLTGSGERGAEVVASLDSALPWTRSVTARESSSSEYSAKYQTESSLRWRIDQERSRCRSDKGTFSHTGGFAYCNKTGSSYTCEASATCYCRK